MKSIETKVTYFLQIIFSFSLTAHSANLIYNFVLFPDFVTQKTCIL